MNLKNTLAVTFSLFSFILLASCSSSIKHNYYLLSPSGPASVNQGVGIGIGPIITAAYLDRPYLIFQTSDNTLDINKSHEWAGDLERQLARVLGTDVGRKINSANVQSYPWVRDSELDYQVAVDIKRFHGTNNGKALLEASWRVYELPGSRKLKSKSITMTEPLEEDGFASLVAAQSRLIDRLSAEIAHSLPK